MLEKSQKKQTLEEFPRGHIGVTPGESADKSPRETLVNKTRKKSPGKERRAKICEGLPERAKE